MRIMRLDLLSGQTECIAGYDNITTGTGAAFLRHFAAAESRDVQVIGAPLSGRQIAVTDGAVYYQLWEQ
jgi:hypothetical protein